MNCTTASNNESITMFSQLEPGEVFTILDPDSDHYGCECIKVEEYNPIHPEADNTKFVDLGCGEIVDLESNTDVSVCRLIPSSVEEHETGTFLVFRREGVS